MNERHGERLAALEADKDAHRRGTDHMKWAIGILFSLCIVLLSGYATYDTGRHTKLEDELRQNAKTQAAALADVTRQTTEQLHQLNVTLVKLEASVSSLTVWVRDLAETRPDAVTGATPWRAPRPPRK